MTEGVLSRRERREASDLRIIESAINCFGDKGYTNTTMAEIAKRAGVTGGLLVQRFDSKEKMFYIAFLTAYERVFERSDCFVAVPICLYNLLDNMKNAKKYHPESFQFVRMVNLSKDLPNDFQKKRRECCESRFIYKSILEAQKEGLIVRKDPYLLLQAFVMQVSNQIEISDRFGISYPEDEYFFRIFQFTDEEKQKQEVQRKKLFHTFCRTFGSLILLQMRENQITEISRSSNFLDIIDEKDARGTIERYIEAEVLESDQEKVRSFLEFDFLQSEMRKKKYIYQSYLNKKKEKWLVAVCVASNDQRGDITELLVIFHLSG